MDETNHILAPSGGKDDRPLRLLRDVLNPDVRLFYDELAAAVPNNRDVIIDLADVNYLCGAAWQVLLSLQLEVNARAARLCVQNVSDNLLRAASILGADQHLSLRGDRMSGQRNLGS